MRYFENETKNYRRLVGAGEDSEPPLFDAAGQAGVRAGDEPPMAFAHEDAIVRHDGREASARLPVGDELPCQAGFSCSGGAEDQHAVVPEQDGAPMQVEGGLAHAWEAAGRRTVKRAPRRGPSVRRLVARILPRWASMIWRQIERPRPEFWPKPWSGLSV